MQSSHRLTVHFSPHLVSSQDQLPPQLVQKFETTCRCERLGTSRSLALVRSSLCHGSLRHDLFKTLTASFPLILGAKYASPLRRRSSSTFRTFCGSGQSALDRGGQRHMLGISSYGLVRVVTMGLGISSPSVCDGTYERLNVGACRNLLLFDHTLTLFSVAI